MFSPDGDICMIGGMAVIARGDAQRAIARTIPDNHDDPEDPVTTLLLLGVSSSLLTFRCVGTARTVVVFDGDDDDTKDDDDGDEGLVGATKATTASDAATIMTTTRRSGGGDRMMDVGFDTGGNADPKPTQD